MLLATAEQMRRLDSAAINDYGIPGIVLMENAGRGAVDFILDELGDPAGSKVSIFVGPGNNGGDGLVMARHLMQYECDIHLFLLVDPDRLSGDALVNYDIAEKLKLPIHLIRNIDELAAGEKLFEDSRLVIDSIFGTGLTRPVSGHFAEVIDKINQLPCHVLAIDIASGLDSDTGQVLGTCIRADLTATFGLAKPGHFVEPGSSATGALRIVDISIPEQAVLEAGLQYQVIDECSLPVSRRSPTSHKGTYGHLLVVAGSSGKTGAAILAVQGALRCGTGLVSLCAPVLLNTVYETSLLEAMTVPMRSDSALTIEDYSLIMDSLEGKRAVVLGPGLGQEPDTEDMVRELYQECQLPMVVDADGLNILASSAEGLVSNPGGPRIVTPHPGEMSRLTGKSTSTIQKNRLQAAADFASQNKLIVVLKGAGTVIAAPDGRIAINTTGNPGMASGGVGDVLAGIIGGLLCQGYSEWDACCLAVFCHGLAADRLAQCHQFGYLASEVAEELPGVFHELFA
jgi:NAD(P)H-hydrate epimerase